MTENSEAAGGSLWPLWGAAAGILGIIAHIIMMPGITDEDRAMGPEVITLLERGNYHVAVVSGFLSVFCLLALASGWRRFLQAKAPFSLAAGIVPMGIVASAGALILAYGFKGMLSIYLPGGTDLGALPEGGLFVLFIIDDMAAFMGWYGVAMAAWALAWISLRERHLPIWFGIVSTLFALVPTVVLILTGLPGIPGIVMPAWLVIVGIGMTLSLRRSSVVVARPGVAVTAS